MLKDVRSPTESKHNTTTKAKNATTKVNIQPHKWKTLTKTENKTEGQSLTFL